MEQFLKIQSFDEKLFWQGLYPSNNQSMICLSVQHIKDLLLRIGFDENSFNLSNFNDGKYHIIKEKTGIFRIQNQEQYIWIEVVQTS